MVALPDLAVVGPLARSAGDLALAMDLVCGADSFQEGGWHLALPKATKRSLSDYRVAIWPDDDQGPVSAAMSSRVQELGDRLAKLGATVSDTARPKLDPAENHRIYGSMLAGAMSLAIPDEPFAAMVEGASGLDPANRSPATAGILDTVQRHREWLRNANARAALRLVWREFFEDWDILLCPQMATTAFHHDHSPLAARTLDVDGTERPYFEQLFWAGLPTLSYLPSTVFPTGPAADGLPIGLQAVSAEFNDFTCIEFARLIEQEMGGFVAPDGYQD